MSRRRRGAIAMGTLLPLVAIGGCSRDDPGPLSDAALPSAAESTSTGHAGFPSITNCPDLADRQASVSTDAWASKGYAYWVYELSSGDNVSATVLAFDDAKAADAALADIAAAIASCADDPSDLFDVTPLSGLPRGVTGYRASQAINDTTKEGSMVLSKAGSRRIVTVSASRVDGQQPRADVEQLLQAAVDAAPGLSGLESEN